VTGDEAGVHGALEREVVLWIVSLEDYGNKSPYQRMCAFESMDGIITSAENG
jgi:hypothetical protein